MADYLIRKVEVLESEDVNMPDSKKGFISVEDFEKQIQEYKQLVFKGQMIDFIVAFILGAALNNVAKSISENLIMPVVSYALTSTGQNWEQLAWHPMPGLKIETGKFLAACISFVLIAVIMFMVWAMMKTFTNPNRVPWNMRLRKWWRWMTRWKLVHEEDSKGDPVPEKGEDVTLNITSLP